jgi:hypothetical protein
MKPKKIIITLVLVFCIITVVPLILMLIGVANSGYHRSMLGELIGELE